MSRICSSLAKTLVKVATTAVLSIGFFSALVFLPLGGRKVEIIDDVPQEKLSVREGGGGATIRALIAAISRR